MSDTPIYQFWPGEPPPTDGLTDLQRKLCDRFVDEFLFDRDVILAAIRCGFTHEQAKKHAFDIYSQTYTQIKLRQRESPTGTDEDVDESDRRLVRNALRQMTLREFPATQVAAVTKLAGVLGMTTPKGPGVGGAGSVMTVPGIADVDDWESIALPMQADLTRNQVDEDPS